MSVKKVLLDAAEHIKTYGWCQGDLRLKPAGGVYTEKYQACALGALFYATGMYSHGYVDIKEYDLTAGYFVKFIHNKYAGQGIVEWNYSPDTTKEDVIAAFELAAENCTI